MGIGFATRKGVMGVAKGNVILKSWSGLPPPFEALFEFKATHLAKEKNGRKERTEVRKEGRKALLTL